MALTRITQGLLASNAVTTASVSAQAVIFSKLAPNSVTTASISAGAVTADKLAPVDPVKTNIFGNGSTTSFAVNGLNGNLNPNALTVFIDGVMQEPSTDYTISGSNIVFSDAPLNGARVVIIAPFAPFSYTNGIPSDNTVSTNKIQDGAVTSAKTSFTDLGITGKLSITSDLTVQGSLTAFGDLVTTGNLVYLDTAVSVTSALSVVNVGTGPALVVQQKGSQPVAEFYDQESGTAMFIADSGKIGLGTRTPNETLTVVGAISATGNLTYNRGTAPVDIGLVIAFS